ncbi:MAG: hypothetical protein HC842_09475, partial [Cytophagales bacterium]|nr:hypothetical protein [Cytophagales bacterium]
MLKDLKIKVCGMMEEDNLRNLLGISPDYVGLIFYHKSPRAVNHRWTTPCLRPSCL